MMLKFKTIQKGKFFVAILLVSGLISATLPYTTEEKKERVLLESIIQSLNAIHYMPQRMNDEFSEKVYDLYMERIDGSRRFLTQEDIDQLKPFRPSIDNQISSKDYAFFDKSVELLEAGIIRAKTYFEEGMQQEFAFDKAVEIELDGEKRGYPANADAQRAYWKDLVAFEVMTRFIDKKESQEDKEAAERKSDEELMDDSKKAVQKLFGDWFTRLDQMTRKKRMDTYLNAITNVYDPHTSYFAPKDKEDFDINMSGRLEGIGARLVSEGEYVTISSIVPGSPSAKQGDLEPKDKIVKVTQDGGEPVTVVGMHIDDVVSKIRGKKGTKVILTVKKVDGTLKDIPLIRDIIIIEEGFAKSVMLKNKAAKIKNVGYIKLPRFYADFRDRNGRFCSKDVLTEINKLKEEGAKGIILDLRNNGGGSLSDVVKMSGYFIEEGPIVQVKTSRSEASVHEDADDDVQFDGALVVLVNQFSASASEILAAAMQDYKRAIIVGTPTYGKGTVQRFYDLDNLVRNNEDIKPLGAVKLTIQKFFRVNGGSTQLKGVTPDIVLPSDYAYIETGESEYKHSLQWTEIESVEHTQDVYSLDKLDLIRQRSQERVAKHEGFQKIQARAKHYKEQRENTDYWMDIDKYNAEEDAIAAKSKAFEGIMKDLVEGLEIINHEDDLAIIEDAAIMGDEGKKDRNEDWVKSMKKDIYIEEAMYIMKDMMKYD